MISVFKNGMQIKGWKSVSVGLSLSTVCNCFSLSQFVADDFDSPVLFPGDAVRIEEDGELLIDGYVDSMSSSFADGSHTIDIDGREKTCDLVDCSLKDFGLSWKKKTAAQIVESVCSCFGLTFNANGVKTEGTVSFSPGSKRAPIRAVVWKMHSVGFHRIPCESIATDRHTVIQTDRQIN